MTTLLPCPFCGGKRITVERALDRARFGICENCYACGPEGKTNDQAIAAWNTRILPTWQPIETFTEAMFSDGFAYSKWFLVATSDGRVTEAHPFIMENNRRIWPCARGENCADPRWPTEYPRCTVTHWMHLPDPPRILPEKDK